MAIDERDWKFEKEFNAWFKEHGPKYDNEDDPDGEWSKQVRYWAWEAWRTARKVSIDETL